MSVGTRSDSDERCAWVGQKRVASDDEHAAGLNDGQAEAATLAEVLAVDPLILFRSCGNGPSAGGWHGPAVVERARHHRSDTVRGWGCFIIGAQEMSLRERLAAIRYFADDPHFGVREWAWFAVRPAIADRLDDAFAILSDWAADPSDRIRRFASERHGPWCLVQTYRGIQGQS